MRKQSTLNKDEKVTRYFPKFTGTCKIRLVCHNGRCEIQEKEKHSPLVHCGLEITIKMKVRLESQEKRTMLSAKVAEITYPVDSDYKDDSSKDILKSLQVEEEDDNDKEESEENFDDDDDAMLIFKILLRKWLLAVIYYRLFFFAPVFQKDH